MGATALAMCWMAPVFAGETILYEDAPEWVDTADLQQAAANSETSLQILDRQLRIEDGRLWDYLDTAYKVSTPQDLTQMGTIYAEWMPDKGDLIVHEIAIIRGDRIVDVVAAGGKLDVLRRELSLEQRIVDGQLTATMAVPGLQIGDTLRVRYSVTRAEQALANEVESLDFLFREPDFRAGFARILASWAKETDLRMQAGPDVALPQPVERGGYNWLEIDLPLDEAEEMPGDAPMRFHRPSLLQLGTFDDWAEVSRVMAPLYAVDTAILPGSELAGKVAAIRSANRDSLDRAVAALDLVQDEIGYLANGMDGGNYMPQAPQQTWDKKFGDCKAKTVLLLALLHELDIEAEGFLVSTSMGDALPGLLPMPGVFDHVIVRASIDGKVYFLDGTGNGANRRIVGNVPPFIHGLPLRTSGATIQPIVQTLPRASELTVELTIDQRAGLDIPAIITANIDMVGIGASYLNAAQSEMTREQLLQIGQSILAPMVGTAAVYDVALEEGADDSELQVTVRGLITSPTKFEGKRAKQVFNLPISRFTFNPDRARKQWRDIPVSIGEPNVGDVKFTLLLPDERLDYQLTGSTAIDTVIAGKTLHRDAKLEDKRLVVHERIDTSGGEIAVDDIAAARRASASLTGKELALVVPEGASRRWIYATSKERSPLAPVEEAYAALIASDPKDASLLDNRARFRLMTHDYAGSLEDVEAALDIEGSADRYHTRSVVHAELLDRKASQADLQEAYDLDATPWRALALADAMGDNGEYAAAIELVDQLGGGEDVRLAAARMRADVLARSGDVPAALEELERVLEQRPNDAILLNSKCWLMGSQNFQVESALPVCTKALENVSSPAVVLDSRAMAYLRLGRLEEALKDAEAAIDLAPGVANIELLRGLILREMKDSGAQAVIDRALAQSPAIGPVYRRFGFDL